MLSFIKSPTGLTIIVNGKAYSVATSHPNYQKIVLAIASKDEVQAVNLINYKEQVQKYVASPVKNTGVRIQDGVVYYDDEVVHNLIAERILAFMGEGLPFEPLSNFLGKLYDNPSRQSLEELYPFLEKHGMPITEDGDFLATKVVSSDWYSKTVGKLKLLQGKTKDGRIYNAVGETIECRRNDVDDNRNRTCSEGLHCGSLTYSGPQGVFYNHGDHVIIVKVNPRDVVSVPADHGDTKMRICLYKVVQEYSLPLTESLYANAGTAYVPPPDMDDEYWDEDEDDFEDDDCDCDECWHDASDEDEDDDSAYNEFDAVKHTLLGNYITFSYGKKKRHGEVDEVKQNGTDYLVTVELSKGDPSFSAGMKKYRNFNYDEMSNIKVV